MKFWPGFGPNRAGRFRPTDEGNRTKRTQTQSAKGRIQADGVNKTQGAKANIGVKTPKTQPGKARVTKPGNKATQGAKARIKAKVLQTYTALGRIQVDGVNKTQGAKGRVTASTSKTQPAKGRVKVLGNQQTQTARANINPPNLKVLQAAAPSLTVQYGTFTLNDTNSIIITTPYDSADTSVFGNWYCEFDVRFRPGQSTGDDARDDAAFATMLRAVESDVTGLRTPRQRLLVMFGGQTVRDWNFTQAAQTAFLIQPELELKRQDRRSATYGFRVRCQVPGNIPNNFFRRESLTSTGTSLRENRTCTITATWTSSAGKTSLKNYSDNGDAFFTAYLPTNNQDQYGNTGVWIRADENPVATNDELSLTTATRVFWECFAARRESQAKSISTIGDRRVFVAPSVWVATTNFTALQNYTSGGDGFYGKILPTPVTNGAWIIVDEEPAYNDQNGVLTVTRPYHEVVKGLREYHVQVTTAPEQTRRVVVSGTYYATNQTAYTNFSNDCQTLVRNQLAALTPPVLRYESKSVPKVEGYDTTGLRYFFQWTINELAYPQSSSVDDTDITISTLDIAGDTPYDAQSLPNGIPVTRLQTIVARFGAVVDYTKSQDPNGLWASKFRGYVLNAVVSKLGGHPQVDLLDEKVAIGLHNNTLSGVLYLLVTGGSVLSMKITQTLTQIPATDFAPRGDGTSFSAFPNHDVAEKILHRQAVYEYVSDTNAQPPAIFTTGNAVASGFGLVDTGINAQDSIDAQNAGDALSIGSGWFIDRRAHIPYAVTVMPTSRGVGFNTVIVAQTETWRYLAALEPGTAIPL